VTSVAAFGSSFASSHRAHRDLHSFPTRRSSDLNIFAVFVTVLWRYFAGEKFPFFQETYYKAATQRDGSLEQQAGQVAKWLVRLRSEEHTSELQSRETLVCRLLPETKKTMAPRHS